MEDSKMRKRLLFVTVLLPFLACSRTQEIDIPEAGLTLVAMTETSAESRTVVEGETHVFWEPGDEIKVFSEAGNGKFVSNISAPSATASFTGTLDNGSWVEGMDLWAVYPYSDEATFEDGAFITALPSVQVARAESFGKDMNLAVAHSTDNTLQFYNVGGGVRFSVTEEGIQKVVFEGLEGESLSGKVMIGFNADGQPEVQQTIEGCPSITLLPPGGNDYFQTNTWYYFVVIPRALENGYKLSFYKGSNVARRVSNKAVVIKRSLFGSIEKADWGLDYEPIVYEFPVTKEEWAISEQMTISIAAQSKIIVDRLKGRSIDGTVDASSVSAELLTIDGVLLAAPNEDGKSIVIQQIDGVYVTLLLEIDGIDCSQITKTQTSVSSPTLSPARIITSPDYIEASPKKALLLSPYQNSRIQNGKEKGLWQVDIDCLRQALDAVGYSLEAYTDSEVTLDKMTGDYLSQYGVVMYVGHGGSRQPTTDGINYTTVICTGQRVGTLPDDFDDMYRPYLSLAIYNGNPEYFITVPWLYSTTLGGGFDNSFVYIGACKVFEDDDFCDYFWDNGAGAFGGFEWYTIHCLTDNEQNQSNAILCSCIKALSYGLSYLRATDFYGTILKNDYSSFWDYIFNLSGSIKWRVKENGYLVFPRPYGLRSSMNNNRARLTWEMQDTNGDYSYDVYVNDELVGESINEMVYWIDVNPPTHYSWYVVANLRYNDKAVESYRSDVAALSTSDSSEYVDLGLSVKWSKYNLGSTEIGKRSRMYYAWGETEMKSYYDWSTYKWGSDMRKLSKYCSLSSYGLDGFSDIKTVLDLEDDVAHQVLGGKWRIPTKEEWQELLDNCTWVYEDSGYKGTSKVPGFTDQWIHIPTVYCRSDGHEYNSGRSYWSSSLDVDIPFRAYVGYFDGGASNLHVGSGNRDTGYEIRPVYDD